MAKTLHLPKHIMVANDRDQPTSLETAPSTPTCYFPLRAPKSVDQSTFSNINPFSFRNVNILDHDKAQQARETVTASPHTFVAVIHKKPTIKRELQIWKQALA